MCFSWSLFSPFSFFLSVIPVRVFPSQRHLFSTASGCIYSCLFQFSSFHFFYFCFFLFLSGGLDRFSVAVCRSWATLFESNYLLCGFTAVFLLTQKPFLSRDFLNSPRSFQAHFSIAPCSGVIEMQRFPWLSHSAGIHLQASRDFLLCRTRGKRLFFLRLFF